MATVQDAISAVLAGFQAKKLKLTSDYNDAVADIDARIAALNATVAPALKDVADQDVGNVEHLLTDFFTTFRATPPAPVDADVQPAVVALTEVGDTATAATTLTGA